MNNATNLQNITLNTSWCRKAFSVASLRKCDR